MRHIDGPLAGIRVLDLGRMMAGPYCGRLLAMMGAEVIKIENEARFDTTRILPPVFEGHEGKNGSTSFNMLNINKKSFLVDLSQPEGKELFLNLVRVSDVVLENFSPRVMPKLGLHYEALRQERPDIILASLSGFGTTGPEKDYLSYATVVAALAGLTGLNGFAGGPPYANGPPFPDFFMGAVSTFAIVAALVHRDLTGEGQFLDVSQLESTAMLFPEAVLDWELNRRLARPAGNARQGYAPAGVYQCAGDDRWLAIYVTTDAEWQALCDVLGQPECGGEPRFATVPARCEHSKDLDRWLEQQMRLQDADALFHALQGRGVSVAISTSVLDLIEDRHVQARGLLTNVDHPVTGKGIAVHPPWRLTGTPSRIDHAAAMLGEHTRHIVCELLGLSKPQVDVLEDQRVLA